MKLILFIIIYVISFNTYSQKFQTEIGKAYKVEVKAGVTNIKKADTVIVEIHTDIKSKLFVDDIKETIDSSGIYTTTIHLTNPYSTTIEVDLEVFLDSPAIKVECLVGVGVLQEYWKHGVYWSFFGTVRSRNHGGNLIITSTKRVKCTIKGVEGIWKIN